MIRRDSYTLAYTLDVHTGVSQQPCCRHQQLEQQQRRRRQQLHVMHLKLDGFDSLTELRCSVHLKLDGFHSLTATSCDASQA
jgi:hypothetical protein